jgi:hypothetical protein
VRALVWPLFACSEWAHPDTLVADTTGVDADLASVRLVGVGSASHCCCGQDGWRLCSGHYSLGLLGLSKPLWWLTRNIRALLWPLFAWSSWAQPATVVAGTTGEGVDLSFVRSVDLG